MASITITAASVKASSTALAGSAGKAGEPISAGESCFVDPDDGKIYLADGNVEAKMPSGESRLVLALNTAGTDQPLRYLDTNDNLVTIGAHGLALATPLFQSATPGKLCPYADVASGNFTTFTGVIVSTTQMSWGPSGGTIAVP